jgi:nitroreductase
MVRFTSSRTELLRSAAYQARLAPSVHNTQPWVFVVTADALEIHADRKRQLAVLDPDGRQLLISCGCALFNARAALAAHGYRAIVERFPEQDRPDLVARITLPAEPSEELPIAVLNDFIISRQTNRRRYLDEPVPPAVVSQLLTAAQQENAMLVEVQQAEHRLAVARLTQHADTLENADPAYRAELRAWTHDDPSRPDGVPAMAVPHVTGHSHDDIPIRDFDTRGTGLLPTETRSHLEQCLLILGTAVDDKLSWLQVGQALERIWLEATRQGYVASLFTQVIEIPYVRQRLRTELSLTLRPHILMRIGKAAQTSASMRRRLQDVLVDNTVSRD